MPAPSQTYYSVEQVFALPEDGQRYELVYGELIVSPSPSKRHQNVVLRLARMLADYCEQTGAGETCLSPADLTWGRTDVLTQPDVFVLAPEDSRLKEWSAVRHVILAAEVGSPSTLRNDRFGKRKVYQDMQVAVYWIFDLDAKTVEVWTPEAQFPVVVAESLTWHPLQSAPPLVIDVRRLFAE